MQKELNPDLFGETSLNQPRVLETGSSSNLAHQQNLQIDQKFAEVKSQMQMMLDQMNRWVNQVQELARAQQQKFEGVQMKLGQLERNDQALSLDNAQKLAALSQKLGERKTLDMKIQEMIERHNSVLKSYELRLSQLQKLIAEREQQIVTTQAALNEAKMEIARMKRL